MNTRTRGQAVTPVAQDIAADIDTTDIDIGSLDKSIDLDTSMSLEELRDSLNAGSGHIDAVGFKDFAENIAFMEEKVLVRVQPSSEPHAERIAETWNNGTPQFFVRDEWVIARRKFVEVLARALPYSLTTPESLDGRGDKTRRIDIHHGQRFPFEMKDTNPMGAAWLNRLYMER